MTQALFGDDASRDSAPGLERDFDVIDGLFGKALKGRKVPEVEESVKRANVSAVNTFPSFCS